MYHICHPTIAGTMKSIFVLFTLVCFSIGEDERVSDLDLDSLLNDSNLLSLLKRLNVDEDCDAMTGTVAVGKFWGKTEKKCTFNSSHSTIIKTKESLLNGAKFLKNLKGIACAQGCIEECCNLVGCDVAVYEEKEENNCYLFNCSKPDSCIFAPHALYRSIVVVSETDVNVDHAYQSSDQNLQEKHENELQDLKSDNNTTKPTQKPTTKKSTPHPVKNTVPLFAECSWWSTCADPNAVCLTEHCGCKDGYHAKYGVCRQSCGDFSFECNNKGMNSTVPDCIYKRYQCDGTPQCADGSDETDCDIDYQVDSYIQPKQSSKTQYYGPAAYQPIYPSKNALDQLGFFGLPQRVSSQQHLPLSQSLNTLYSNPDPSQMGAFKGQYYIPGYGTVDTQSGSYQSPWQMGPAPPPQSKVPIGTGQQLYPQQSGYVSSAAQNMPTQKSVGEVREDNKQSSAEKENLEISDGFHAGKMEPTTRTHDGSSSDDQQKDNNVQIAPSGTPVEQNVPVYSDSEIQHKSRKPTSPPSKNTTESDNINSPQDFDASEDKTKGTKADPDVVKKEDFSRYGSSEEGSSYNHDDIVDTGSQYHAEIKSTMEVTTKTSSPIKTTESQIEVSTRGSTSSPYRSSKILDNSGENVDTLQSWDGISDTLSHQRKTNSESHAKMEAGDSYTQSIAPQKNSLETRKESQNKDETKIDLTEGDRLYNLDRYKNVEDVDRDSPYYTGTNSHSRGQNRGPVRNTKTHRQHKYPYQENPVYKGRGHPRKGWEDYTDYYYQSPSEFDPFSTNQADFYDYGSFKTGPGNSKQTSGSRPNTNEDRRQGGHDYGMPTVHVDKPADSSPTETEKKTEHTGKTDVTDVKGPSQDKSQSDDDDHDHGMPTVDVDKPADSSPTEAEKEKEDTVKTDITDVKGSSQDKSQSGDETGNSNTILDKKLPEGSPMPNKKIEPSSSPVNKDKSALVNTKTDSSSFKDSIRKVTTTTTVPGNDTDNSLKDKNYGVDEVIVASPTDSSQGPIVALSVGLAVTLLLLIIVGCRLRTVRRRLRKGRVLHSNEADYLINGMYL